MTKKEIKELFLQKLPAPYGQQAADNVVYSMRGKANWNEINSKSRAADLLMNAFIWSESKEGRDYWSNLYQIVSVKGTNLKNYLGDFDWKGWKVRVWKNLVAIGCQRVSKKNIQLARAEESFTNGGNKVTFTETRLQYGGDSGYGASKKELLRLWKALDKLNFPKE